MNQFVQVKSLESSYVLHALNIKNELNHYV